MLLNVPIQLESTIQDRYKPHGVNMEIFMIKLLEEKYQKKVIIYNDMYLFFNSVAKDFISTCNIILIKRGKFRLFV